MKLVIDIDEVYYKAICERVERFGKGSVVLPTPERIIFNGIPLPKNHGRLIDADELSKSLMERWHTADNNAEKQISQVMADVVTPIVVSTPTIIEADKENNK